MFKRSNWTMKNAAFFFILICAIAVSFWGISALLITAGAPLIVALAGGFVFDALALWLGHEAVEVALSDESATGLEMITYLVVGASMYLNWLHAELAGMTSVLPYVMALFPLAAGILFHFYLKRQSKKARKEQDRMVNRNPVIGRLTWLRYPGQAFSVWSKSIESNIKRAATQIPNYEIEQSVIKADATLGEPEKAPKNKIENPKPLPQLTPAMSLEKPTEPLNTPVVEAKEDFKFGFQATPTFTATKPRGMAIEAYKQGFEDHNQIAEWISKELGQPVNPSSVQKYKSEAKK